MRPKPKKKPVQPTSTVPAWTCPKCARIARLQAECHDARILLLIGGLSKEVRDFRYSQYEAHRSAVDAHNDLEPNAPAAFRSTGGAA